MVNEHLLNQKTSLLKSRFVDVTNFHRLCYEIRLVESMNGVLCIEM